MAGETELDRMVIRLIGDGSSYQRMLKTAEIATAKSTARIAKQLGSLGKQMSRVGRKMSLAITAPIVGIGALATREFANFETALSQIEGLVGLSTETVKGFSKEIKNMAGLVGKGPTELAEAMFFITSGGLRGKQALEALEQSARAATAGLGETASVANAVTSAMNAYGPASLSATRAVEILTAAVREGKASAESFAPVLGQILPLANELEVDFAQTAGAIAFLTKSTGSASLATTGLRGVMTQLVRPTSAGEKALKQIGLSVKEVRKEIRERGLLKTLILLRSEFKKQDIPISKMFQDIEGLNAVLQLTGPQAKDAAKVIANVGNSAGIVDEAFDAASKTVRFQWNQAMADAKVAMLDVGGVLAPVIERISALVRDAARAFSGWSARSKELAIQGLAVFAALGPVLFVTGKLVTAVGSLIGVYNSLSLAMSTAAGRANLLKGALIGVTAIGITAFFAAARVELALLTAEANKSSDAFVRMADARLEALNKLRGEGFAVEGRKRLKDVKLAQQQLARAGATLETAKVTEPLKAFMVGTRRVAEFFGFDPTAQPREQLATAEAQLRKFQETRARPQPQVAPKAVQKPIVVEPPRDKGWPTDAEVKEAIKQIAINTAKEPGFVAITSGGLEE